MRAWWLTGALLLGWGCGRTEPYLLTPLNPPAADAGPSTGQADGGAGPQCILALAPTSVDFGQVPYSPGSLTTASATVGLVNLGDAGCTIGDVALSPDSDPEFGFLRAPPGGLLVEPGNDAGIELPVTFVPTDGSPPRSRTGTLTFNELAPERQSFSVPLQATVTVGCLLQASPLPLDFGNVPLNTSTTAELTLTNSGDAQCIVSDISLGDGGSPLFSLPNPILSPYDVGPGGGTMTITLGFIGSDSSTPHQRLTSVDFVVGQPSGQPRLPTQTMSDPVRAYIDTACLAGSQLIYTVDSFATFSTFDPLTLTFTDLGTLSCPTVPGDSPFSMAVDQSAIAWVEYVSGNLFRVDTGSLDCTATSFQPDPAIASFGMGFVFDPQSGIDTLYVAGGGPTVSTLATLSFPALALTPVGTLALNAPELAGTGDGQLWGFSQATSGSTPATLAQIDPTTAETLTAYTYAIGSSDNYAMKFWGGSFWIFTGNAIYQVDRTNGSLTLAVPDSGHPVVGAGVSTCAPLQ